jgi:tetratricopeptide (TPR) repeat protein
MSDVLSNALALHQAGQWAGAARLYRQVLARSPDDPEALHLLGVLHHQQGQHARAAELIGRAITLRPGDAAFHSNLAEACRALGQLERAAECYRTALRLRPQFPEALCGLGQALAGLGQFPQAVVSYQEALQLRPDYVPAHTWLGLALRQLRQPDAALAHFARAAELAPASVPARANLGRLLLEMGRPAEALPPIREALRLQPGAAELHHLLGNALRALGQPAEAEAACREALRLAPDLAPAQADLGLLLRQQGRLLAALPWLKRAAERHEQNIALWIALAETYRDVGKIAESIPCCRRVLALDPNQADAHLSLGWALQEQGRRAEAAECYRTVVRLRPNSPAGYITLGGLHEEQGELAEAEAAYRTALRVAPKFPPTHGRLAKLLGGKLPDADLAALEALLPAPQLKPDFRASLLFGLVQVFDERGEYARAAEKSRQANAVVLEWARGRRDYDPAEFERYVDGVEHHFDRDFFARVSGGALDTRRPVFVFGLPRSGTTLIEQVLASHPLVFGAGEVALARDIFQTLPSVLGRTGAAVDCVPHLDAPTVRRLAEQLLDQFRTLDEGRAERVVDKMLNNYMIIGFLAALFPQATFIHCKRDIRDTALSCWLNDLNNVPWANDVGGIAVRFRQYLRLMAHWKQVVPVPIHEVAYEETVEDLEGTARRLIAACGLEWDPACLEFHRTKRVVRTASLAQVRRPVYKKSVARWKRYEGLLDDLFAALPREESPA